MAEGKENKVQTTVRLRASIEQRLKRHVYQLKIDRGPNDELPTREGEIEAAITQYLDRQAGEILQPLTDEILVDGKPLIDLIETLNLKIGEHGLMVNVVVADEKRSEGLKRRATKKPKDQ